MMHNWRPSERLDSVLDRSIDRLDEEDPESILRDYPQSRNSLAPMLHIADALRDLEQVSMPSAAKQAGRERLRKAVLARQRRRPRSALANGMRMAAWVAVFLFVCTGAIGGLTRASANTLPDEPLYSWKRATERVWLGTQTTTERKVTVSLALADRRVDEMKRLYQRSGRVYPAIINQLQIDYTRTLQLIDTLPPEQAQPLLAQAKAVGAEHEHELMQLAQQATGEEQQILLAAVEISQWVQHTSPEQATASPPPALPDATSEAPTDEPSQPSATINPSLPGDKPQPTSPVAPPASEQPTTNNPATQPGVPATPLPATPLPAQPKPTTAPPAREPSAVPQPSRPARPAPTERVAPPRPTAQPEPTAVPATEAPTDTPPGPPSNPPGNPTVQPGPPIDPPGQNKTPGPPSNPPGNPTVQPGPPVDPPGQPTARPEPTVDPPGQPTARPGPPIDPPGQNKTPQPTDPPREEKTPRPTNQPGPPNNPPGNPTAQPGPPSDPPGNGQPGPPSNPPGNPTAQPGPPNDPPGKKK